MKFLWFIIGNFRRRKPRKPASVLDEIIHDDWYKPRDLQNERMQKLRSKNHLGKNNQGQNDAAKCRA